MNDPRIPVTIVTGFLGSGKTTLLNNIIRKYPDKRFAVIENEIGETGIDGELIIGGGDNIFELSNGCICCSLSNDFIETIENLFQKRKDFDYLLVETTGIADPNTVVQSFLSDRSVQMHFRIDSVICLADAVNVKDRMDSEPEIRKQLALADLILLNKTENTDSSSLREHQEQLASINPSAGIYSVSHAGIDSIDVLDLHAYTGKNLEKSILSFRNPIFLQDTIIRNTTAVRGQKPVLHEHDIQSLSISIPGSLDLDRFNYWIESFLFFNSKTIFRVKGILSFEETGNKVILQAVSSSFVIEEGNPWNNQQRFCKLVFIGKNLQGEALERALYKLVKK